MSCFYQQIIYIDSSVQQTKYYGKKYLLQLYHFVKKYCLFISSIIEIQQKVKLISLKISNFFHPMKKVPKSDKSTSAFLKLLSTCVKSPKDISFNIFITLNPKWIPRFRAIWKTRHQHLGIGIGIGTGIGIGIQI